ncbi:RICIN domain-containing protein [Dictyobacter kobayashii]|uniref:Ricin B lectin domain-containing protein n=1 Tax=Dictyobacter kobayashii TaxID=2014872 RepID=A0A402ADD4_9CHLR|nr:RICIN domain-containing protein [Dictyobacter kobayashii]GCE17120.1 hypothetical protein KDK_09200 [Dictyobacter kobayashii]
MLQHCKKYAMAGLSFLVIGATLFSLQLFNASKASAATSIVISPGQQYQTLQGWGTSLAWWANIIGGWSDSQRTSLADALYDPNKGIGLNVVRYNFGADGPGNVCHNQMGEGRNVPSFEPTQGNFDWTQDANQLWFAQAAQARGANVFEGFVNSPPAWMLNNSCTAGGPNGAENLNSAHYNDYANYIATIDQHFHDSFGITLQTVDPFNEPSGTYWNSTGTQEGMYVSTSTQNTIIPLLATALNQNGASAYTQISAPDDFSVGNSVNAYNSYSSSTKADLAQWNTHTYAGSDSDRNTAYASIGQTDNKRLWMSEWGAYSQGSDINAALALSNEVLDDEQHLHPSAWVAWQAVNEGGAGANGQDVWGLALRDGNNNISYPARYYAMGNYSKFVRPGSIMIGNNDASTFTALNPGSNSLTIVATNNSSSDSSVSYDLSAFTSVGSSATPYQTTASENLQQLSALSISNNTLSTTLPAQSITTFVIPNTTYNGGTGGGGGTTATYKLVNRNSGKVADVNLASTDDGAPIIQFHDNGGANQHWNMVSVGNGYYKFVNVGSGKVLEVSGQSTADGGGVDQYTDNGGTNQQWSLVDVGGGYDEIVNRNSGKVLDVNGQSTSDGATIQQWSYWGGANQQWQLVQV